MDTCPVCKTQLDPSKHFTSVDYISGETFRVISCNNCGLGVTDPRPNEIGKYYPNNYRQYNHIVLKIIQAIYGLRTGYWTKGMKPGSVLEIGCGDGIVLDTLRKAGWHVMGTERHIQAVLTSKALDLPIFTGDLNGIAKGDIFNLIIMFQVLEHLDNPLDTIHLCAERLKPGGKILIGVPNFDSWQQKLTKGKWFHLDVPRHLSQFTLNSIKTLFEQENIQFSRVSYEAIEHDPYGWAQSLLNLVFRKKNILTRELMHLDPMDLNGVLSALLVAILIIPVILVTLLSWVVGKGAIIYVEGIKEK